jgi:hypothetical protein
MVEDEPDTPQGAEQAPAEPASEKKPARKKQPRAGAGAKRAKAERKKQPKAGGEAKGERKRRLKEERQRKSAGVGDGASGIDARLERIEEALAKQSQLNKELLLKVEALVQSAEPPATD